MSSFKNANKTRIRTHRERSQVTIPDISHFHMTARWSPKMSTEVFDELVGDSGSFRPITKSAHVNFGP